MKILLHNPLLAELAQIILKSLSQLYGDKFPETPDNLEQIINKFSRPPDFKLGHFAFPCFFLSKQVGKAPALIGQELAAQLENNRPELLAQISHQGPYINFYFSTARMGKLALEKIENGEYFKTPLIQQAPKLMVEYSQPNTHKELHVGHMRNLCLGNALVRLLRYTGHETIAATFPGDVGTHVAKCLWYYRHKNPGNPPVSHKGAWLGELYSKANNLLEDEKGSAQEEKNRLELTQILKQLESRQGEYYELWKETREWSIALMQEVYSWANIHFDKWYWESEFDSPSLQLAREYYRQGFYIESEGAIGMDLGQDGLGFCMTIKSDGTGLYATKDIMLAQKKFNDFKLDKSIYVVDKRQAHHFKQVFKVLEKVGFEHAKDCYHLQYDFVELPDGPMSSRKGNIVPLMELVEKMQNKIKGDYLEKYRTEWSDQEIDDCAKIVAEGAIKYGMIRMDNSRKIVFDMNEWLKLDGETGPYLQYVHARIRSLCDKQGYKHASKRDWSLLTHPAEQAVVVHLTMFNNVMLDAALQSKTPLACAYLYDLAKLFNSFYAECSIAKAGSEEVKNVRLALSYCVGESMKKGLEILGIEAPEKM